MALTKAVTPESARSRLAKIREDITRNGKRGSTRKKAAKKSIKTSELPEEKRNAAMDRLVQLYRYEPPKGWDKHPRTKKNPLGAGRAKAVDENTLRKLEYAFAYDATVEEACVSAGIYPSSYYDFIKRHPQFTETVALLRNIPVLMARRSLVHATHNDPEKALRYLERKRKTEFSPKLELAHEGEVKHTHSVDAETQHTIAKVVGLFAKKAKAVESAYIVVDDELQELPAGTQA